MSTLVVGASGATGRLLVEQLLTRGGKVIAIVRSPKSLPEFLLDHDLLKVVTASIMNISNEELQKHVVGCDAIASCLGHNLTLKGLFGPPRKLVTEATRRLCTAIEATNPNVPVKFVLMNTAGNSNWDLDEKISFGQKVIIALLRLLLPPHADNEQAADYLRTEVGKNDELIDWTVVRPDSLIDQETGSDYELHPSPVRSAIFNPGKTSRINVANFMAQLITNDDLWKKWKGQMPVIYNRDKQ